MSRYKCERICAMFSETVRNYGTHIESDIIQLKNGTRNTKSAHKNENVNEECPH